MYLWSSSFDHNLVLDLANLCGAFEHQFCFLLEQTIGPGMQSFDRKGLRNPLQFSANSPAHKKPQGEAGMLHISFVPPRSPEAVAVLLDSSGPGICVKKRQAM